MKKSFLQKHFYIISLEICFKTGEKLFEILHRYLFLPRVERKQQFVYQDIRVEFYIV